jgi:hypothetical protein
MEMCNNRTRGLRQAFRALRPLSVLKQDTDCQFTGHLRFPAVPATAKNHQFLLVAQALQVSIYRLFSGRHP